MSDPVFPLTLPAPLAEAFAIERKPLTNAMDNDAGGKRVRAVHLTVPTMYTFSWKFTLAQYATFSAFYENDLGAAATPFLCPLDDKRGGLNAVLVIFTEAPVEVPDEGLNWRVSVKVMTSGVAVGKFPRLINVDGASGGEAPGSGGTGGVQDPARAIKLDNYILSQPGSGSVHVVCTASNGRLVMVDASGQKTPIGMWKAATNTTPSSQYSWSSTLTTLEYRDIGPSGPNNPEVYSQPPVTYNANPNQTQQLSVEWKDADVNSITSDRRVTVARHMYFPYIKYLLTLRVKDLTSGYVAIGLITITVGTKPAGRENS